MKKEKYNRSEWEKQLRQGQCEDIIEFAKEHPDGYRKATFEEYPWVK